jgi:hypothetical protein
MITGITSMAGLGKKELLELCLNEKLEELRTSGRLSARAGRIEKVTD